MMAPARGSCCPRGRPRGRSWLWTVAWPSPGPTGSAPSCVQAALAPPPAAGSFSGQLPRTARHGTPTQRATQKPELAQLPCAAGPPGPHLSFFRILGGRGSVRAVNKPGPSLPVPGSVDTGAALTSRAWHRPRAATAGAWRQEWHRRAGQQRGRPWALRQVTTRAGRALGQGCFLPGVPTLVDSAGLRPACRRLRPHATARDPRPPAFLAGLRTGPAEVLLQWARP